MTLRTGSKPPHQTIYDDRDRMVAVGITTTDATWIVEQVNTTAQAAADWTKDTPDQQIGIIRLACGHAKLWRTHLHKGVVADVPGWRTHCWHCGEVEVEREIARGEV